MTLYPNTQNPIYLYQETAPGMRGGMMFTLNTDAQGQTLLFWTTPPEEVVMACVSLPQHPIGIDESGQIWTGEQVLHFIKAAPAYRRYYHRIGEQV